jgi:hypothetical protein
MKKRLERPAELKKGAAGTVDARGEAGRTRVSDEELFIANRVL